MTAFIIGLSASSANGQNEKYTPNGNLYLYDSAEVAKIAELILENETLRENEKLYREKDSLYNVNRILFENKISSVKEIVKLEKTPLQVIDNTWKWWHYTLAAIGAVTFGFTVGVIYENAR